MYLFKFLKPGETKKFVSTCLTFFLITLTYSIVRRIKDTIIITKMSAEIITFIKIAVVLPMSILLVIAYNWLSSRVNKRNLIYIISIPMIVYFLFYGLVEGLYPELFEKISLNINIEKLGQVNFIGFLLFQIGMLLNNIYHVILYVNTEMYGSLILSFMFWRHVNEFTKLKDVGRLYPSYIIAGSISTAASGLLGKLIQLILSNKFMLVGADYSRASTLISLLIGSVCASIALFSYKVSLKEHLKEEALDASNTDFKKEEPKKKKVKLSFIESIKTLVNNKVILLMTICVMSYMASINIVEVSWKKAVKNYFMSDRASIDALLSESQLFVGTLTVTLSIICHNVINRIGWTLSSLVNPIALGITGMMFLGLLIMGDNQSIMSIVGVSPILLGLKIGQIQNIASKACKYSFFDTTKEMALITLDKDLRDRGKASIDVLGGRFGKSAGSLIQQILIALLVGSSGYSKGQETIAPYLFVILTILVSIWICSIILLGREIRRKEKNIS